MIAGIGLDLVDIAGFSEQLSDGASVFVDGTFTASERHDASHRPGHQPARHLAARFAAKEAFVKAWSSLHHGQAPTARSVDLREIEVVCDAFGRPSLVLHGRVAALLLAEGPLRWHVSLSHDGGHAAAVVVLEIEGGAAAETP